MPYLGTPHHTIDKHSRTRADGKSRLTRWIELGGYIQFFESVGESLEQIEAIVERPIEQLRAARNLYNADVAGRLIGIDGMAIDEVDAACIAAGLPESERKALCG